MFANTQRPEPRALRGSLSNPAEIDFHSMFYTMQGEGPHIGKTALFIRLAGCNLQCPMCDTEYTQGRRSLLITDVIGMAKAELFDRPAKMIVITGGEPTRQDSLVDLIEALLLEFRLLIQIESNGVLPPTAKLLAMIRQGFVDYIVSPKTSKVCDETKFASTFKYVVDAGSINSGDGLPLRALGHKAWPHIARPPQGFKGEIFVSPADTQDIEDNLANLIACRESVLRFGYRMTIQLHKLVNVE